MVSEVLEIAAGKRPLAEPLAGGRTWLRGDFDPRTCVVELERDVLAEIDQLVRALRREPLPVLLRKAAHYRLPRLSALMETVREQLIEGPGIAVLDRLPLETMEDPESVAVYWIVGQMLAQPVAQKWDGTVLYDVTDTGQTYSYGVRGSATNVELVFHNDNAFGQLLPDYVGLLCLRPAYRGGVSRFCSVYSVHNALRDRHPEVLERLYQPVLWDRQAEHPDDAPKIASAPVFSCDGHRLVVRANNSLIEKGYAVAGESMDGATQSALATFMRVAEEPQHLD